MGCTATSNINSSKSHYTIPYGLKISKGENFRGFLSDLENFNLKHFGSSKMPLKTYFQSQVTAPLVINILSVHYL